MANSIDSQLNEAKQFLMVSSFTKVQKIVNSLENDQLTGNQLLELQLLKLKLFNEWGNHGKCIKLSSELISEYDNQNIQIVYIDIIIELVKALLGRNQHEQCLKEIIFAEDIITKFENKTSQAIKKKIASLLLIKGTVHIELGKYKIALNLTNQGITLYKEIQDKLGEIQSNSQLGNIHLHLGKLELAIEYLEKSLLLLEQNQNPLEKSKSFCLLGKTNIALGNYKQGLIFARKSLKLAKRVGNDKQLFNSVNLMANVYILSGESTNALKYRQEALNLAIKSGNVEDLETTYLNLSFSYRYKGDLAQAFLLLEKSLKLSKELKNNFHIANALYELITVAMDLDKNEKAQKYLKELENIQMSEDNPIIKQEFQLASAYTLKKSQRPKNKFEALNIFKQITNKPMINFELYLFALLNYSELLFYEYQISNHSTILDNIERVLNLLYSTAKKNDSFLILVQAYWLQSKYALIQLNVSKAKELLFQAQFLAEEKELKQLSVILEKEYQLMNEQIIKQEEYLKNNVPLPERLESTQIQHLIETMIQKRTNFQTDNLLLKQTELLHEELERRRENFIWITNHEIRTPLTVVSGFIDFLQKNIDDIDQDKRNRILKLIKRNLDRLERLSDQISLLSHLDRGSLKVSKSELKIDEFLSETFEPYVILLEKQFEVSDTQLESSLIIEGDKDLLQEVLEIVLDNAVKHTHPNKRRIKIDRTLIKDKIQINISDNGAGISPENIERIFLQFVSIPTEYSAIGTGLGLYLAQQILEEHGGMISAKSKGLGFGTTFSIILPRVIQEDM